AAVDRDRAVGHLSLGGLSESLGDIEGARKEYETAIRIEPRSVGARANLANLFEQQFEAARQRATQLAQNRDRAAAEREFSAVADVPPQIERLREEELGLQERDVM